MRNGEGISDAEVYFHKAENDQLFVYLTSGADNMLKAAWQVFQPGESTKDAPYSHPGEELGIVLAGTVIVQVGDERYKLNAGDSIAFKSAVTPGQKTSAMTRPSPSGSRSNQNCSSLGRAE